MHWHRGGAGPFTSPFTIFCKERNNIDIYNWERNNKGIYNWRRWVGVIPSGNRTIQHFFSMPHGQANCQN